MDSPPKGQSGGEGSSKRRLPPDKPAAQGQSQPQLKKARVVSDGFTLRERRKKLFEARRQLPVFAARKQILSAVRTNRVVVLVGETGSGKTTQIPQFLYEDGFCKDGSLIAITQPRRVAAVSVARRVAEELGSNLGDLVGYSIRFDDMTCAHTRIKYMTDGMLLRETLHDADLSSYSIIILDEAHERTVNTDVLFALVKGIMQRRADVRLVVMSATLQSRVYSEYFGGAVLHIPGRLFPVEIFYTAESHLDYLEAALTATLQIHLDEPPGDVLVFLTGQEEIEQMEQLLEERTVQFAQAAALKLIVCPIFAALHPQQQLEVVLATNIAETSVTISGVRYVVDPGLVKERGFHGRTGMEVLQVVPVSKSSARQRSGRAGREAAGKCFRLYTEPVFKTLDEYTVPEIKRCNLASVVLQLRALGVDNPLAFDFLDPPSPDVLLRAMETLLALGALDSSRNLTPIGRKMADFPLDPEFSKIVLLSQTEQCTNAVLSVVAMLSVESIFFAPRDKRAQADLARKRFAHKDGDHLTLYAIYHAFNSLVPREREAWCWDNFINSRSLKKANEIRAQLEAQCTRLGLDVGSQPANLAAVDSNAVLRCFVGGLFMKAARRLDDGRGFRTLVGNQDVFIHPASVLCGVRPTPPCVIYGESVMTTRRYLRDVSAIESSWLIEMAPTFYKNGHNTQL
eukprot:gnl/Spiro4/25055_TR12461_c0_g1_i1.p1 gnl/Spiro4/25055_TR12461_c0_g1~~gnl/Spiro4/25055_TR12461_c0_g1_i1.p1  ORF type:complete len:693 (+),score=217.09 gnl/Spiro4/25055_TR12461_c0_g1_i1:30-2081(+)